MLESVDTESLLGEKTQPVERRSNLQAVFAICLFGWLAFTVVHFFKGYPRATAIDAVAAFGTALILFGAKFWPKKAYWFSQLNLTVAVAGLTAASINMGTTATAIWFIVACPLVASYHHGFRETVFWTVASMSTVALIHVTPEFFPVTPEYIPGSREFWFAQTILLGMVAGFAVASNRANRSFVVRLQERESQVRDKAKQVREHASELQIARDSALESLRVRSEFVANVSHEIRTPLNGVLGMTRVLLESGLSHEQEMMVRTIDKSGKSLLGVINEILDFSKLESGAAVVEEVPFDLRECIEDVLDLYSGPAHEKDLDIAYVLEPTTPVRVVGDVTRLRQILLNLISNAVKFTSEGEVFVHVWNESDGAIHFEVRDTGIGIDAQDQDRLFQSFVQVDASTTRKFGGTGLGLSISRRLAETLGGTMWVESEKGVGSSFHFTVYLEETDSLYRTGELTDPMSLFGRRMLVVSPDSASRDALLHMADLWGVSFGAAASPAEIAETIKTLRTPHVVVVFDGAQLGEVRSILGQVLPDGLPPIVVVAALADPAQSPKLDSKSGDALLLRPIRYRQLREILDRSVAGHAVHSPRSLSPFDPTLGILVPLNIVVAEDNAVNQQVIEAMLNRLGYEPRMVGTGTGVVELVTKDSIDLVFMDMHMPEMDGIEATKTIRSMALEKQPAIVAITADVTEAHRCKAKESGMDEFLGKPLEVEALVHCIEQIGKGRGLLDSMDTHEAILAQKFDATRLDNLRELFPPESGEFADLIEKHVLTTEELVRQIRTAIDEGDAESLKMSAHSLKSTAAMFGAVKLSMLSRRLETLAEEDRVESASGVFPDLSDAWKQAQARLQVEVEKN